MDRLYVDTSVLGGCFDEEFSRWSIYLINEFKTGMKISVISDLTLRELEDAPTNVRNIINDIPDESKEYIIFNDEARKLANLYIAENVVSKNSLLDAQHIALATINKVDFLISWNFKHIVNMSKIRHYNSVNLKYGYAILDIRTPMEVISYE